jgi:pimeloyl-ACP methyl ester carboxylesterase
MKKLALSVAIAVLLIVLLLAFSFIYLHLSSHKAFEYEIRKNGLFLGTTRVDRYVTGERIIYKGDSFYPNTLDLPFVEDKLVLDKRTATPGKYIRKAAGLKGTDRLIILDQNGEVSDYLYKEPPRYMDLSTFETGKNTLIFLPGDIMSCMAVFEKYNYWKKGSQFFEIMIPSVSIFPPMRDKLEIKYLGEEYVRVSGRKIEAEKFLLNAPSLERARISMSKYSHIPLYLHDRNRDIKVTLLNFLETPEKKINAFRERTGAYLRAGMGYVGSLLRDKEEKPDVPAPKSPDIPSAKRERDIHGSAGGSEVFFESGNIVLSGRLWEAKGSGTGKSLIVIPEEGPRTNGEQFLVETLGRVLSISGIDVLVFNWPGQRKSQGDFTELTEEVKMRNIGDAVTFLSERTSGDANTIVLMGHRGGGYTALRAAGGLPAVGGCVMLGLPEVFERHFLKDKSRAPTFRMVLDRYGLGEFSDGFENNAMRLIKEHLEDIIHSGDKSDFFLKVELPREPYRDLLRRTPYRLLMSFRKPLLMVTGRDEPYFDPVQINTMKDLLRENDRDATIAVFRGLPPYAGELTYTEDGRTLFIPDEEIFALVRSWVKDI